MTQPKLTKRQSEVLFWIQKGASNKHIAKRIGISESTIKAHVTKIMEKYGIRSRVQLALNTTGGQKIEFLPIQLEQKPVGWVQLINGDLAGFMSGKKAPGENWKPVYLKLEE